MQNLFTVRCRQTATTAIVALSALAASVSPARAAGSRFPKLDAGLQHSATAASSVKRTRVIVTLAPGAQLPAQFKSYVHGNRLSSINAQVLDLPDSLLGAVSTSGAVTHVHGETTVFASDFRTNITSGAFFSRFDLGFGGAGVGVALVDSGVANHPDLNLAGSLDFTGTGLADDAGHGTHVAGIIAGSGLSSGGQQAGVAPGVTLRR